MTVSLDLSKDPKEVFLDSQKAFALPIGAASPLWLMFAGAASAGVAYWWLNRWRAVTNLEAVLAPTLALPEPQAMLVVPEVLPPVVVEVFEAAAEAVNVTVPEPVAEAIEDTAALPSVIEAAAEPDIELAPEPIIEPAIEPVIEAAPDPVVETPAEPVTKVAPEPAVEVTSAPKASPKPKSKAATARAAPRTTSSPTRRS